MRNDGPIGTTWTPETVKAEARRLRLGVETTTNPNGGDRLFWFRYRGETWSVRGTIQAVSFLRGFKAGRHAAGL